MMYAKDSRGKKVSLPALPDSWNRLSSKEMESMAQLMELRASESVSRSQQEADRRFKLRAFLLFTGLRVVKPSHRNRVDGFCFRRRGWSHRFERIPMQAWQVNQWIDASLGFLDKPMTRLKSPYGFVRLGWRVRRFKAPADLLSDTTFHQYLSADSILASYWDTVSVMNSMMEQGTVSPEGLASQREKARILRCRFLATLFNPPVWQTGEIREGRYVRRSWRRVWSFSPHQTERNARLFRRYEKRLFPVMLQFFQSVQEYYARMFPHLYTSAGKGSGRRSQLQIEVDMVNNLMKYQGFSDYDAVYDSEAVRILGIMNTMSKEAKEIERMNQKYKSK